MRYVIQTVGSRYGESFNVFDVIENEQVGQSFFSRVKADLVADNLNFKGFDMFNLISEGLNIQRKIVDANHRVTDKEVKAIKDIGLSLVCRPDNLTNINEALAKRDFTPDEAA